ncbi:unnamed protein product [Adineta steineri]|uniref:Uncharacterized protein n=1 Tax=Adineta steineri TaxID=433720 RepID=A0A819TDJ3_9BILA|nr:unnamed protein product [Adineta steineri]
MLPNIQEKTTAFQDTFEMAAKGIIDIGIANVIDQQQQIKQHFMNDLFSGVVDEIHRMMLIQGIEPIRVFGSPATLKAILYKIQNGRNARLPEEYLRPELFRRQVVSDNKMKKYLINKKDRNFEVHQASTLINDHSERQPSTAHSAAQLSDFIANSIFAKPSAFTRDEIRDTQPVYQKFIKYSRLNWKEKLQPTSHLWIKRPYKPSKRPLTWMEKYEVGVYVGPKADRLNQTNLHTVWHYERGGHHYHHELDKIKKFRI